MEDDKTTWGLFTYGTGNTLEEAREDKQRKKRARLPLKPVDEEYLANGEKVDRLMLWLLHEMLDEVGQINTLLLKAPEGHFPIDYVKDAQSELYPMMLSLLRLLQSVGNPGTTGGLTGALLRQRRLGTLVGKFELRMGKPEEDKTP